MKLLYLIPIVAITADEELSNSNTAQDEKPPEYWCDRFSDVYQDLGYGLLIPVENQVAMSRPGAIVNAQCDRGYASVFKESGAYRREDLWRYDYRHPFRCNNGTWEHRWEFQYETDFTCEPVPCYNGVNNLGFVNVVNSWNNGKSYVVEFSLSSFRFNKWVQPHGTETDMSEGWTVSIELQTPITSGSVSGINTEHVNVNPEGNFITFHSIPGKSDDLWHEANQEFKVVLLFDNVDLDQSEFRSINNQFYFKRYQNLNCAFNIPNPPMRLETRPEETMVLWNGEAVDSELPVAAACDPNSEDNFCHRDEF